MVKRDLATTFGTCCRFFDRQPVIAYGAALGCVALAFALRAALGLVNPGIVPFATLYPALVAAALLGGPGPGMTALMIGVLGAWGPAAVALASPSITEHSREPGRAGHNGWRVGGARRNTSQSDHPAACEPGTAPAGDPINGPGHVGSRWCHRLAPLVQRVSRYLRSRCLDPSRSRAVCRLDPSR